MDLRAASWVHPAPPGWHSSRGACFDRSVGGGGDDDDRIDLAGWLDALEPGTLTGAMEADEGLEEEPVGDEPGLPTRGPHALRQAEDLADLGVAFSVDPGKGRARVARLQGKAPVGDRRTVFGVAVGRRAARHRTMMPMAAIAAAARMMDISVTLVRDCPRIGHSRNGRPVRG